MFAQNGPLYSGKYDLEWSIDTNGPDPDNSGNWNGAFIPPNGANTSWLDDPIVNATSTAAERTFDIANARRSTSAKRSAFANSFRPYSLAGSKLHGDESRREELRSGGVPRRQLERVAVERLEPPGSGFVQALGARAPARLVFEPARRGVLSWNALEGVGRIEFRLLRAHVPATDWIPYAAWHPTARNRLARITTAYASRSTRLRPRSRSTASTYARRRRGVRPRGVFVAACARARRFRTRASALIFDVPAARNTRSKPNAAGAARRAWR